MFKFHELDRKVCLTCQYFNANRKLEVIGRQLFIDYEKTTGTCRLFNNVMRLVNQPGDSVSWCHYKRWIELP